MSRQVGDDDHPLVVGGQRLPVFAVAGRPGRARGEEIVDRTSDRVAFPVVHGPIGVGGPAPQIGFGLAVQEHGTRRSDIVLGW